MVQEPNFLSLLDEENNRRIAIGALQEKVGWERWIGIDQAFLIMSVNAAWFQAIGVVPGTITSRQACGEIAFLYELLRPI